MQNDSDSLSLIILAFVAGFIILQLRRTLGRRDGYDGKDERDQNNPFKDNRSDRSDNNENVIPLRTGYGEENEKPAEPTIDVGVKKSSPFYATLEKICKFDRSFTLPLFIDGAEYAYGMILNAFWTGDSKTLKNFLNRDVFAQFDDAVKAMKDDGKSFDNTLNDIEKIELVDASIEGSMAELTVKYSSHMTIAIKDDEGNVVEGDPEKVVPIVDVWTFCRDVKRNDPNWTLVSTSEA